MLTQVSMNSLETLAMQNCGISNEGIAHLSKGNWKDLKKMNICNFTLNLEMNNINYRGLSHLIKLNSSKLTVLMF